MTEHYLNDERRMIQEVARDFTMNEVLPVKTFSSLRIPFAAVATDLP